MEDEEIQKGFVEESQISYKAKDLISFLLCPICKGLVRKPILSCHKCGIYGCGACMLVWEKMGKRRCLSGCEDVRLEKIKNPLLYAVLDGIEILCSNSRNKLESERCGQICTYANYVKHQETCQFAKTTCKYCSSRVLASKYNDHVDKEHPILTKIYFIFLNSSSTPMQYNIHMGQDTTLLTILERLHPKVKVEPENLELVTIKDNRISSYISKSSTLRSLKSKEGFLFAFQKFTTSIPRSPTSSSTTISSAKSRHIIHLEVSILSGFLRIENDANTTTKPSASMQRSTEDSSKSANNTSQIVTAENSACQFESYPRIFHFIDEDMDFASIHLMIYRYIRHYFKTYVEQKRITDQVPYVLDHINFEDDSEETLEKEYALLGVETDANKSQRQMDEEESDITYSKPYSLLLLNNLLSPFPDKTNLRFSSFYKLDPNGETSFELALALAPYLDIKSLKLNRCLESVNYITSSQSIMD